MEKINEMDIEISIEDKTLSITKDYVGEPVSNSRLLVVQQKCRGIKTNQYQLYKDKQCDFTNFKYDNSKVTFDIKFYNPDNGMCDYPKKKSIVVKTKKCN